MNSTNHKGLEEDKFKIVTEKLNEFLSQYQDLADRTKESNDEGIEARIHSYLREQEKLMEMLSSHLSDLENNIR
ncbi:MAG: hypothetical protein HKN31_14350 [Pricia sp.]|nr:hypothetical protein [Pricia sp.]